jgi:hypothetical protein
MVIEYIIGIIDIRFCFSTVSAGEINILLNSVSRVQINASLGTLPPRVPIVVSFRFIFSPGSDHCFLFYRTLRVKIVSSFGFVPSRFRLLVHMVPYCTSRVQIVASCGTVPSRFRLLLNMVPYLEGSDCCFTC